MNRDPNYGVYVNPYPKTYTKPSDSDRDYFANKLTPASKIVAAPRSSQPPAGARRRGPPSLTEALGMALLHLSNRIPSPLHLLINRS
jgi:hypothetical protein